MPTAIDQKILCYHCGEPCDQNACKSGDHHFCCTGCLTVFEILKENKLEDYYNLERFPGKPRDQIGEEFNYLDHPEISDQLLRFKSDDLNKVDLHLPQIHCSSCIWLLEHLSRLHPGIIYTRTDFGTKRLRVEYHPQRLNLRKLAELLSNLGYKPSFKMDRGEGSENPYKSRTLVLQIGVAGFCFGNIMLLSFPEYLGLGVEGDHSLKSWITYIQLALSLPVIFYCSKDYYRSALNSFKQKYLNLDVPITLGITALFIWSLYEIVAGIGPGYLDTLSGLLFLLLVGKWFQQKTYQGFSFDRDYRAYFPLAVTKIRDNGEEAVMVRDLKVNDVILIRNQELIPADSVLLDEKANIDYSFVTGEDRSLPRVTGDIIYAGGRQLGAASRYRVLKPVEQSRLTELWDQPAFSSDHKSFRHYLVDRISQSFTYVILSIAILATAFWLWKDPSEALFVFASVLIVACPCAISMATPYTLSAARRVLGLNQFYIKNNQVIERLADLDNIVFDKTGTLTLQAARMRYTGQSLSKDIAGKIKSLTAQSAHPVSREIYQYCSFRFPDTAIPQPVIDVQEIPGQGIRGKVSGSLLAIGNAGLFDNIESNESSNYTYISLNEEVIGYFEKQRNLRPGINDLFSALGESYSLSVLSGDGPGAWERHKSVLSNHQLKATFNQSPLDKLNCLQQIQKEGLKVAMVGDGLNDAGAMQQSDVGIAVTENIHQFTPASDAIMKGEYLPKLSTYLKLARWARRVIIAGFILSFFYNVIGLSLAVSAQLTPLVAAILMPVSSISIVILTTLSVHMVARNLKLL